MQLNNFLFFKLTKEEIHNILAAYIVILFLSLNVLNISETSFYIYYISIPIILTGIYFYLSENYNRALKNILNKIDVENLSYFKNTFNTEAHKRIYSINEEILFYTSCSLYENSFEVDNFKTNGIGLNFGVLSFTSGKGKINKKEKFSKIDSGALIITPKNLYFIAEKYKNFSIELKSIVYIDSKNFIIEIKPKNSKNYYFSCPRTPINNIKVIKKLLEIIEK